MKTLTQLKAEFVKLRVIVEADDFKTLSLKNQYNWIRQYREHKESIHEAERSLKYSTI